MSNVSTVLQKLVVNVFLEVSFALFTYAKLV
jgi:hypothetical protein